MVEKVKKLCAEKGITIYKLEKELGFSNCAISKWNISIPRADKLKAVADYLGKPMEYFFD